MTALAKHAVKLTGHWRRAIVPGLLAAAGIVWISQAGVSHSDAISCVQTAAAAPTSLPEPPDGKSLFDRNCAFCHGEAGDGRGPAAPMMTPRPRNFADNQFHFVTAANGVPSDDDLLRVITRGIPGTAMQPFAELPEADRLALAQHVRELTRVGFREVVRSKAINDGLELSDAELDATTARKTTPEGQVEPPRPWPAATPESLIRGRQLYRDNCVCCHGPTGHGDGEEKFKDPFGQPFIPADLTRGAFKGGGEREQLFARVVLGIPGSPMPANPALTPIEVADVVNFILALPSAPTSSLPTGVNVLAPVDCPKDRTGGK